MQFVCPVCQRTADIAERALLPDRPSRTQCPGCRTWLTLERTDVGLRAAPDPSAPAPKNPMLGTTLAQPQRFDFDLPSAPPPGRAKTGLFQAAQPKPDVGQLVQDFSVLFRVDTSKKARRGKLFAVVAGVLVLGAVAAVLALQQQKVAVASAADAARAYLPELEVAAATPDNWVILPLHSGTKASDRLYHGTALASHAFMTLRKAHMAKLRAAQAKEAEAAAAALPEPPTPSAAPAAKGKKAKK